MNAHLNPNWNGRRIQCMNPKDGSSFASSCSAESLKSFLSNLGSLDSCVPRAAAPRRQWILLVVWRPLPFQLWTEQNLSLAVKISNSSRVTLFLFTNNDIFFQIRPSWQSTFHWKMSDADWSKASSRVSQWKACRCWRRKSRERESGVSVCVRGEKIERKRGKMDFFDQ